jgi:adenylate kinase
MLRVVFIAPPGAGKGTQATRIAEIYGVPHVSSGELLRSEVARRTETGRRVADQLERGELVEDSLVCAVIFKRLSDSAGGFVLDGFPRTLSQAVATEEWTAAGGYPLDAAIELQVPRDELVNRIHRRSVDSPRSDDTLPTVLHRLDDYDRTASELVGFYRERGILVTVDGTGDVDAVTRRIRVQLDRLLAPSSNDSETG